MFWNRFPQLRDWKSFFQREIKGSIAIESAFLLPVFALLFIGTTVFFQVQRVDASYLHAATTLGDLITRQRIAVDDSTADSLYATAAGLVASTDNFSVVLTSVSYDGTDNKFVVNWSSSNIVGDEYEDADIQTFEFPAMEETESVMLVIVQGSTTPLFGGLFDGEVNFLKHSIRRPRFLRLIPRA